MKIDENWRECCNFYSRIRELMTDNPKQIDLLRREVWMKAIGTPQIDFATHYFVQISHSIREATGYHLHQDTIRNFFQGQHQPRPRTLDIYSTYALGGDQDAPRTFQEFMQVMETRKVAGAYATPTPPVRRRILSRRRVLLLLLPLVALGIAGYYQLFNPFPVEAIDRSIAVLPFKVIGDPGQHQYLADGITEAIINDLGGISDLLVISRTSVEQYRQTTKNIPDIASELGVAYLLEGRVQQLGDQLRITVQLIDGKTDRHRWTGTFDRRAAEILAVQDDIAESVASSLRLELLPEVRTRMKSQPTVNLEAYDHYLRGQQHLWEASSPDVETQDRHLMIADSLFRLALALDPNFALAYTGRAKVYQRFRTAANIDRETPYDSVLIFCNRALELDPDIPDAYVERSYFFLRNFEQAKARNDLLQALALNPNHSEAALLLANIHKRERDYIQVFSLLNKVLLLEHSPESLGSAYLTIYVSFYEIGDFERSEKYLNRLIELAPEGPDSKSARLAQIWFYMITGRFQEGLEIAERFFKPDEEGHPLRTFGELHLQLGNYSKALDYFLQVKALVDERGYRDLDNVVFLDPRFGQVLYFNGRREEGIMLLKKGIARLTESNKKFNVAVPNYDLAGYYAFIGDKENALKLLHQEKNWLNGTPYFILHDVQYDNLRDDPEFQEIIRRVHEEKRKIREEVESVGRKEGWVL